MRIRYGLGCSSANNKIQENLSAFLFQVSIRRIRPLVFYTTLPDREPFHRELACLSTNHKVIISFRYLIEGKAADLG